MIDTKVKDAVLALFESLLKSEDDYYKLVQQGNYSVCCINCLNALRHYLGGDFQTAMNYLKDVEMVKSSSTSTEDLVLYNFVMGYINFCEKNGHVYMLYYKKAVDIAKENEMEDFLCALENSIRTFKNGNLFVASKNNDPLSALVKIGQAVAAEKDINRLILTIAQEAKDAVQADRCTVFLYDNNTDELWSKVALGLGSQELRFNASQGLAGHVFRTGESINIKDAYSDERFNKNIDLKTGYTTKTILCVPIRNIESKIIGVFQILNKLSGTFTKEDEDILVAIGSSAGISLENAKLFARQQELLEEQKVVFDSFIETLAASIDARDKITSGHSTRVRMYATLIAQQYGLKGKDLEIVQKAAILHDIGKIGIRDSVLRKEGKLTDEEYKHIQEHVVITHNILEKIHMSDDFKLITEIACSHHEKYNGTGYHRHLKGEEIPFGGRILAVADVFDAITSKRHYRDKMPIQKVINILISDSGSHFDSDVVNTFLSIPLNKIVQVFMTEYDFSMKEKDEQFFAENNLRILYDNYENPEYKKLVDMFNKYYIGDKDNV